MCLAMRRSPAPLLIAGLALACQSSGSGSGHSWWFSAPDESKEVVESKAEVEVYRRAEAERVEFFEREITRLREDLARAEASIVAMESGLRGSQSRADAVSGLAEARIALDRVSRRVPWRGERVEEARAKLTEGQRQLDLDHVAAAVFFASRAQGIADSLAQEVQLVSGWPGLRVVAGERVNLRAGPSRDHAVLAVLAHDTPVLPERGEGDWTLVRTPSGQVGWVHAPLLLAP
jgi:hypothetical protein